MNAYNFNFVKTRKKNVYSIKDFTSKEKEYFFSIPVFILQKVELFKSDDGKVIFIMMYAHFKASKQFHNISEYMINRGLLELIF